LQLIADWHAQQPESKALIVSDTVTEGVVLEALRYGARGFLLKTCPLEMVAKAIRVVHSGDFWIRRKTLVHLVQNFCPVDTFPLQKPPEQDKIRRNTDKDRDGIATPAPENEIQQATPPASSYLRQGEDNLTDREQEIVYQVSRGLSNKEIAKTLGVSDKTVKTHLHTVFSKLKIRRRMDLMIPPDRRYYC
jgi:DNA-binding NarL/FixJ family response regulator